MKIILIFGELLGLFCMITLVFTFSVPKHDRQLAMAKRATAQGSEFFRA